ncbi:MAG: serine hydrolase domain-containing protein [Thermoanaerobaculales bacterium]
MANATVGGPEVLTLLRGAVAAGLAPGLVAVAAREGQGGLVWCAGGASYGGPSVAPDLRYDLASLTKPLATTTLLLLARRDGLAPETPLGEVLSELAGSPWSDVTLLQCATHTAGFPRWEPLYALGGTSREGYLGALVRLTPIGRPGGRVEYACPGFIALGLALERSGGSDLATLFAELVAEPLGVADELSYVPGRDVASAAGEREWYVEQALLRERRLAGEPPPRLSGVLSCDDGNARGLGGAAGNAGLFGTAAAVARLAAEYLPGGGELVTSEEAGLATRSHTRGLEQERGVGWQLAASAGCSAGPALSPGAFGHTGFAGTSVWVDPVDRTVFVLLANRLHPGGRTPDLHPLRRRFHRLAAGTLQRRDANAGADAP